jgi:site-specific recombinase XerD
MRGPGRPAGTLSPDPNTLHTSRGRPLATQVVARPHVVDLPPALAVIPNYPPLTEVEQRFLVSIRFGSARTGSTYTDALKRFDRFLAAAGVDPFVETAEVLPADVLEHFFRWLHEAGYSRSSVQTYTSGLKAFFRFAVAKRMVPPHLSYELIREGLRQVMGKQQYRSPRIDPRLALILTYVDSLPLPEASERKGIRRLELLRDRALLHVLFFSGMRRAEVASLTRRDVQDGWARDALVIGKGDRERNVFFGEEAQRAIRAYLVARNDALDPLWLRHDNRRGTPGQDGEHWRMSPQTVWSTVKDYARAVGVSASPHHFRHLKASTLLNRGASLSEVQDVLGHANPSTTKLIYAHYTPKFLRAAVEKYSATPAELVAELEAEQARRRVVPGP